MQLSNSQKAFFELVRAGLWEKEVRLLPYGDVDYEEVLRLATEQSVVGLVAAGMEHVVDLKIPQEIMLQFIGSTLQLEQWNKAMNAFIADTVRLLRDADVHTLLVKGQGVAQCYERPLWRACGDVDFYLDKENYERAKVFLLPRAQHVEDEDLPRLHLGMTIDNWIVELHGTMYTKISRRMNLVSDEVHRDVFWGGNVRPWDDDGVEVLLPGADSDVVIVFNHFMNHFYIEGVGVRQICDWCRLLWTFRGDLDLKLLEARIRKAGLMAEWRAFGAFAVDYLGMPVEAMPFYDGRKRFCRKAEKLSWMIMEMGNFGQSKDTSYRLKYSSWVRYVITFFRRSAEFMRLSLIFPWSAPRFYVTYLISSFKVVMGKYIKTFK